MSVTFYPSYFHYAGFDATAEPSVTPQQYACSGGEATGAAYDLVDNNNNNVITIDTNGETGSFYVDFDLTTAITGANFAIVDNHNLKTADANIGLSHDNPSVLVTVTGQWSGPLGSTLTAESESSEYIINPTDGVLLFTFTAAPENTGWTFEIYDTGSDNFDADVTMGEMAIGISFTPSMSPDIGVPRGYEYGIDTQESYSGQTYAFERYGLKKSWRLNWKYLSTTDKTGFETLFAVLKNSKHPFWIDLGETSPPTLYFVRIVENSVTLTEITGSAYSLGLTIEEVL